MTLKRSAINLEKIISQNVREMPYIFGNSIQRNVYECPRCKSTNIIALAWVYANHNNRVIEYLRENNNAYCVDCKFEITIK